MVFSELMDSHKGAKGPHPHRTICELLRELYDLCVMELHDKNPDMMFKMIKVIEDAFIMGIKMNKKLVEYNLGSASKWEEKEYRNKEVDRREVAKRRKKRNRLVKLLKDNNEVLKKYDKNRKKKDKK